MNRLARRGILILLSTSALFIAGCGSQPEDPAGEEVMTTEEAAVQEELFDSSIISSGWIAVMKDGVATKNGIWMSEEEAGRIAERIADFGYTYEDGSLKKSEAAYVANFYNINDEKSCTIYFNKDMDMYYENKQHISDPVLRGIFAEIRGNIKKESVLEEKEMSDNDGSRQEAREDSNNTMELSKEAFLDAGINESAAEAFAQSTFNIGIPVVKEAAMDGSGVSFTDSEGKSYMLTVEDGKIASIWCETSNSYIWQRDGDGNGED